MHRDEPLRVLLPTTTLSTLSRRGFLAGAALSASAVATLTSCSTGPTAAGGGSATPLPTKLEDQLSFFNWADYDDPTLLKSFASTNGLKTQIDVYGSNVEAIAKLSAAKGTAGYDVYVPSGNYIPDLIAQKFLLPLDHSRLPNLTNLSPQVRNQYWDPKNTYSVPKDWGTTGYIYDTEVIKRDLTSWADFVDAMGKEASGRTSVLEEGEQLAGLWFWTQTPAVDWSSGSTAHLDAAERFVLASVAPHIKAYDSYPGASFAQGKYALSMCWNGDARTGLLAAKDKDRYRWVLGTPATELWMDNWTILASAPHPVAAHAWIDHVLDPEVSYTDLQFHGYNTGLAGLQDRAAKDDLPMADLVFFDDAQVATMSTYRVTASLQRRQDILAKSKARSARA